MIYPIVVYGNTVLRQMCEEIGQDYDKISEIIDNMWETMYHSEGIGLAAPQINKAIRVFVIDGSELADDFPELKDFKQTFINAKIIERSEETIRDHEGCLSIPGIREEVTRPNRIRIQYLDANFQPHDEVYEGFAARVVQHEYDHIEGILFTDHLSALNRRLLKGKLTAISQGKVDVNYRIRLPK